MFFYVAHTYWRGGGSGGDGGSVLREALLKVIPSGVSVRRRGVIIELISLQIEKLGGVKTHHHPGVFGRGLKKK